MNKTTFHAANDTLSGWVTAFEAFEGARHGGLCLVQLDQRNAGRVQGVYGASAGKGADAGLAAAAVLSNGCLRHATGHQVTDDLPEIHTRGRQGFVLIGGVAANFVGPLADNIEMQPGEPFLIEAGKSMFDAPANQVRFALQHLVGAVEHACVCDGNAQTGDAVAMGGNAPVRVFGMPHLDHAVAQLENVEGLHRSGLRIYGLLVLAEPRGPDNLQLPDAREGDVFAPLRNRALRNPQQIGQVLGPLGKVDCVLSLHAEYFSTLKV